MDQSTCSEPKSVPRKHSLKLDNSSQCASYTSQQSSSVGNFECSSPKHSSSVQLKEIHAQGETISNISVVVSEDAVLENKKSHVVGGDDNSTSEQWMCNDESMPASMLHPNHRSTPVKECQYRSNEGGEEGDNASVTKDGEEASQEEDENREIFLPGDLQTPIMGYETMEARSRFTVFKIQVQKRSSDSDSGSWFVFRRYSDFVYLNERLEQLFPRFRFALPPKRWFRDNFDLEFLEDRMLGLQAFLDNITGHKDICNSSPVQAFFCVDDPPGPHDSLEESRALCDTLEESMYNLRQDLEEKDRELNLLKEEVDLYKSQVEVLTNQLRAVTGSVPSKDSALTNAISPSSTRHSLAECDRHTPPFPAAAETKIEN